MHLSPHLGPKDPSGAQLSIYVRPPVPPSLCLYLSPSLYLSVSLSSYLYLLMVIIYAFHNCSQRMWLQATGSNTLSGSKICASVRPVVRGTFEILVFAIISSVGVQHLNSLITPVGSEGPYWVTVDIICPSVSIYLSLIIFVAFW